MTEGPPGVNRVATGTPRPDAARMHENAKPHEIPVIPNLSPRGDLLVYQEPYKSQLEQAVKDPNVSVILLAAGTGTGKTRGGTQIALEALGQDGHMVVTENLRRATEESAKVIAADMQVPLGEDVGVRNRYTHEFTDSTRLLFCPVQSLLVMMEDDPLLERYNMVAMDEVHKESKANELCTVRLFQIQKERAAKGKPPLKLMFVSATADKDKIKGYFDKEKAGTNEELAIIDVPGKTFDVDKKFEETKEYTPAQMPEAAAQKVRESIAGGDKGNILVFLSGEGEIKEAAKALRDLTDVQVISYYGATSKEQQEALFADSTKRKVVLATNAAQEGLTLDINVVIDTGMYKGIVYDPATGRQYLVEQKAPKDHIVQRMGRVGRKKSPFSEQNDKYYALFSEKKDFANRPEHEVAEIQRTDLTQEMLILLAQGHDVRNFLYINRPPDSHIDMALKRLEIIGAYKDGRLTERGRLMAELQINPNHSSMVVSGAENGALRETAALAAMLETYRNALDTVNGSPSPFRDAKSDVMGFINIFNSFHAIPDVAGRKRWATSNNLNFWKLQDADHMFTELIRTIKSKRSDVDADALGTQQALDKSIFEGFADSLIHRTYSKTYTMDMGNASMQIRKGSALKEQKPHHFVSLKIEPFLEGEAITGHTADLNHIIPDELVEAAGFKTQDIPDDDAAREKQTEGAVTTAETTASSAAPSATTHAAELPTTPTPVGNEQEPPPPPPTFRQRLSNWFSRSIFGSVWRWIRGR